MSPHTAGDGRLKVLLAGGAAQDRELYKKQLDDSGVKFEVFETVNDHDGLKTIIRENIDCVLLDSPMGDASRKKIVEFCMGEGADSARALGLITDQEEKTPDYRTKKSGGPDYIYKSAIKNGTFAQAVLNAIERAQLRRQLRRYEQEHEKSYLALSEFTHTASHDLKAPLRRIVQYCDLLKEEMQLHPGNDNSEYVNRVEVNARRLQELVDNLLIYARIINVPEEKTEINLSSLVNEVVADMGSKIMENRVTLDLGELPVIQAYAVRMREMFRRLIENAILYRSSEDPIIKISCETVGNEVIFSVADNGRGIDEKYHESVFKAFERLQTQDEIPGSGLGLSICRKIVEIHGGKIWVESNLGHGAVFRFTIPQPESV